MIKHYCDHCGRAVFLPDNVAIRMEGEAGGVLTSNYDLCKLCAKRLIKYIEESNSYVGTDRRLFIREVNEDHILFSDGSEITYGSDETLARNYADFSQLDDLARVTRFDPELKFEAVDYGFRFGNDGNMFFVPCYSEQNGYYDSNMTIYYKDKAVIGVYGEVVDEE